MKKYILQLFLIGLISFSNAQSCLPEGIYFTIQQDIDEFQTNYPGCTEIEGFVELHGSMWDISDLIVLTRINGNLRIIDCDELESLDGFDSLKSIGGNLEIFECSVLNNLTGLENLKSIGNNFEVRQNYNMMSLYGMSSLSSIGDDMEILSNASLKSLGEFSTLSTIGGKLQIDNNSDLTDLSGMSNLIEINGDLKIINNDKLTSLAGINNIEHNSIAAVQIFYNNALSVCEVESICDFISNETGFLTVYSNAAGCNSADEIEEACASEISETNTFNDLSTYPNPFTTSTIIQYKLTQPGIVIITFYNQFGKKVDRLEQKQQEGKQQVAWTPDLPGGIYYFRIATGRLKAGKQVASGKVVLVN